MIHFFVNADSGIGLGHYRRCLNIAIELQKKGFKITFVSVSIDKELINELSIQKINHSSIDSIDHLTEFLTKNASTFLIIDSDDIKLYEINFQQSLVNASIKYMIITINDQFKYLANILFNPSILALKQQYDVAEKTIKLLGPEYFIFSKIFRGKAPEPIRQGKRVFVGFGAADPMNYTQKIVQWLLNEPFLENFEFECVLGGLNPNVESIEKLIPKTIKNIQLYHNISDIETVYEKCDIAICSPGTMFWELSLFGIKSILISSSKREVESANLLNDLNYASLAQHFDNDWTKKTTDKICNDLIDQQAWAIKFEELQKKINPNGLVKLCDQITNMILND